MTFMCTVAPNSSAPMCTGSNMDSTGTAGAMPPGAMWPVMGVLLSARDGRAGARQGRTPGARDEQGGTATAGASASAGSDPVIDVVLGGRGRRHLHGPARGLRPGGRPVRARAW